MVPRGKKKWNSELVSVYYFDKADKVPFFMNTGQIQSTALTDHGKEIVSSEHETLKALTTDSIWKPLKYATQI